MSIFAALMLAAGLGGQMEDISASSPGTISVDAKQDGSSGPLRPVFVDAIDQALTKRGFTTIDEAGHAALVADLAVTRDQLGTVSAPVAKSDPAARTSDSPNRVGAGVVLPFPINKARSVPLQRTKLELRIRRRGSETILWQGTALTVRPAGTVKGKDAAVAADLSDALLRGYPLQSGETISIP
ncbi:hypothetical protein Q4F19_13785 [Sphingomonas sp. BIUV-7]|uniref:DUF4136 domain-containing protein n=1 Tax=Sphingomonas natans TaxID=3063330 RepID=A0ABT8YAT9_9SPHN|nr:hypothetical protein [Sphingomonas sp. BIUV-7]MDO6415459.1 hypothetical protein [Sphingomonas sp. BIUV-7]